MKLKIKGEGTRKISSQISDKAKENIKYLEIKKETYGYFLKIETKKAVISPNGWCNVSYLPHSGVLYVSTIVNTISEAVKFINKL